MFNSINLVYENSARLSAKKFEKKFKNYLAYLDTEIDTRVENEVEAKDYKDYLKDIRLQTEHSCERLNYANLFLGKNSMISVREKLIHQIFQVYLNKLQLEEETIRDRKIEKSLDISNELYAELIDSLIATKRNYNRSWSKLPETTSIDFPDEKKIITQMKKEINFENRKNNKYEFSIS